MTANFQALDATQNEASFIQFKKLNREEIAAAHSIPPSEIGLWENANKANANQQAKNYFLKVIRPYQAKDEAMMNRILRHGLGVTDVVFRFKNVEYTDDQERAAVAMTKAQSYKYYLDGLANVIKTVQGLANGQAAGGGSGGGSFGWRSQSVIDMKTQADDKEEPKRREENQDIQQDSYSLRNPGIPPGYITPQQASALAGVSGQTIRHWAEMRHFSQRKVGNRVYIPEEEFRTWLKNREEGGITNGIDHGKKRQV